ncbi:hypothetical protein TIFTF001_010885 [Ficus carica]|uniref:Uncharacterized protein n=1 Tax=Ficus carica TaxID=3494 RepID=A0AA88D2E2_FICCA|nr:hypothetical protein TIFTF001_010885 [Ficus carica]
MLECDFVLQTSSGYYGLIRSTEEELEAKLGFNLFFEGEKGLDCCSLSLLCKQMGRNLQGLLEVTKKLVIRARSRLKNPQPKCPACRGEGFEEEKFDRHIIEVCLCNKRTQGKVINSPLFFLSL